MARFKEIVKTLLTQQGSRCPSLPWARGDRAHGRRRTAQDAAVPVARAGGTGRRDRGHADDVRVTRAAGTARPARVRLTTGAVIRTPTPGTAPDKRMHSNGNRDGNYFA